MLSVSMINHTTSTPIALYPLHLLTKDMIYEDLQTFYIYDLHYTCILLATIKYIHLGKYVNYTQLKMDYEIIIFICETHTLCMKKTYFSTD